MKKYLSIALLTGALMFSGCGDSENFVFTNNTNVVVAPVCQDDAYTTNEDTALTVNAANGVLANDQPNGGTVTFSATSTQNGTVTGSADGAFVYTPATGFAGTDTFTYTVANSAGQRTCTVTITVIAVNGFFVDAVNGNDGTGSFNGGLPFQTIQAAVAAAPANADIVVLPGNYSGGINLKNGQRLLGSGSVLAQGATRPQLTGPIDLADGNTLDFLRIEGTNGDAVTAVGQNGGTVTNCEFANTMTGGSTGAGVFTDDVRGNWTVSSNDFANLAGASVAFNVINTDTATIVVSNNTMTSNGLSAVILLAENDSNVNMSVVNNVARGNNTVTGDAYEFVVENTADVCLDLETNIADNNTNPGDTDDGVYLFSNSDSGSTFSIEQFNTLTDPQPGGAGNTGSLSVDMGAGFSNPTNVLDGACGF